MFKKRVVKGHIREREKDESIEETAGDSLLARALEMREGQMERKRASGIDLSVADKAGQTKSSGRINQSITTMMTDQYKMGKEDVGSTATDAIRKAIMEKYIADKLGNNKEDDADSKKRTIDDELYVVPENIKLGGFSGSEENDRQKKSADFLSDGGAGIAEVQLPMDYKLKNIQDTENARYNKEAQTMTKQMKTNSVGDLAASRSNFRYSHPLQEPLDLEATLHSTSTLHTVSSQTALIEPAKSVDLMRSTDQASVRNFVKRQKIHNRK